MSSFFNVFLIDLKGMLRSKLAMFWTFVFPLLLLYVQTQLNGRSGALSESELVKICVGLIAIVVTSTALMGFAAPLVQAREIGILRACLLWPLPRVATLAAMASARLVITMLAAGLLIAVATSGLGLALPKAPFLSLVVLLAGTLAFLAIAVLLGARGANTQSAIALCNMVYFAFIFSGEIFFDALQLPPMAASVLAFLPVNALVHALTLSYSSHHAWNSMMQPMVVVVSWGGIAGAIATRIFWWEIPRQINFRKQAAH